MNGTWPGNLAVSPDRADTAQDWTFALTRILSLMFFMIGVVSAEPSARQDYGQAATAEPRTAAGTHSVIAGGRFDDLTAEAIDGGGTFDWIYASPLGNSVFAGAAAYSVGDTRWAFGRLGGAFRSGERFLLYGEVNYGSGEREETGVSGRPEEIDFPYLVGKAGLSYELLARRLYLKLEDQYYEVDDTEGHLLRGGALVQVTSALSTQIDYAESVSGNLNTQFGIVRLDYYTPSVRFLGGVAVGRSTPEIFDGVIRREAQPQETLEFFAGVVVPVSRYEITLAVSHLKLESTSKTPLNLSVKLSF